MKSTLLAAAISGLVLGTGALAHASNASPNAIDNGVQQLDDSAGKHSCKGKNACKGQGGCKSDKHACKGQNACKGQGGCKG